MIRQRVLLQVTELIQVRVLQLRMIQLQVQRVVELLQQVSLRLQHLIQRSRLLQRLILLQNQERFIIQVEILHQHMILLKQPILQF